MACLVTVTLVSGTFRVSLAERVRQFGLLSSAGASCRQLVRAVLVEAALLCAVGIPAGLALGVALGHEVLDVIAQAIEQGLDLVLLGLHGVELLDLLLFKLLEVGLLLLKLGFALGELVLDAVDVLDGLLIVGVDLVDVVDVGDELVKRRRGEEQRDRAVAALLVARRHAVGENLLLFLEFELLLVDLRLRFVDLLLDDLDLAERVVELLGEVLELGGDGIELRLGLVELGLSFLEGLGGLLGRRGSARLTRQAEQHRSACGGEGGLDGCAPRQGGAISLYVECPRWGVRKMLRHMGSCCAACICRSTMLNIGYLSCGRCNRTS